MLEGKEIEGAFDGGGYYIDVDDKGGVKIEGTYEKDLGVAKIKSVTTIETDIFVLAEMMTKKTETTWDDTAVAGLKSLLGIKDEAPSTT